MTVLYTRQGAVTRADDLFQFTLPPAMVASSEVQIEVEAGSLRIYLIEAERKEGERAERTVLRRFLDDKIRASEALAQSLKYEESARVLDGAARRAGRDRHATWWAEMQVRWGSALLDMGSYGEATQSIASPSSPIRMHSRSEQKRPSRGLGR